MELVKSFKLKSNKIIELYKICGNNNGKNILIIGSIHGEEPQGFLAIRNYFFNKNFLAKSNNNIYIIPCLNPDGMKLNQRKNTNGVDLNRNYPTENWERTASESEYFGGISAGSEDETKFAVDIINSIKFDLILTLHSPFAIVNYDGDAQNTAKIISDFTNYPIQADIGYPTPGSFGTYCGIERKIPTITLEYDENEDINSIYNKSNKIFKFLMEKF